MTTNTKRAYKLRILFFDFSLRYFSNFFNPFFLGFDMTDPSLLPRFVKPFSEFRDSFQRSPVVWGFGGCEIGWVTPSCWCLPSSHYSSLV